MCLCCSEGSKPGRAWSSSSTAPISGGFPALPQGFETGSSSPLISEGSTVSPPPPRAAPAAHSRSAPSRVSLLLQLFSTTSLHPPPSPSFPQCTGYGGLLHPPAHTGVTVLRSLPSPLQTGAAPIPALISRWRGCSQEHLNGAGDSLRPLG